ncbi:hypothetical protein GCM10011320_26860 [Neoroseomonas lacus]|uniref:Uncharacterized protein n=1 Tax=Neoroseomonas lacus TaxID=287609 RepID=A0A917NQ99_9PROT|nr:hypothetical protein GCM10011320_26860 [Neoroseomonas lacus]
MAFQQETEVRDLAEILRRDRRNGEAALPFGQHQAFRGEAEQGFPQRPDGDAVDLAQTVETKLPAWRQAAEHDIGPDATIRRLPRGFLIVRCWRHDATIGEVPAATQ